MSSPHSLQGKTVLIAGGAKNLGGLIATDLAGQGAKAVVVHYNSAASRADAEKTVAAIEQAGAKGVALQGDLAVAVFVEEGELGSTSGGPLMQAFLTGAAA